MEQPVEIRALPKGAFFKCEHAANDMHVRGLLIIEPGYHAPEYVICHNPAKINETFRLLPSTLVYQVNFKD